MKYMNMNDNVTTANALGKGYYEDIQTYAHIFQDKCQLIKMIYYSQLYIVIICLYYICMH